MNVMALSRKQEILFMDCKIANSTEVFSETQINTDFRGLFLLTIELFTIYYFALNRTLSTEKL